ncbi:MAG: hypothetical protein J6Z49_06950 [Kiritimatiellae bacterium]|nr:hypothetical protein [Kiritimatiellia bacterium]
MKTNHIWIRPDRLNAPLATCNIGKLSSAVFNIKGDIPDDVDTITVQIGRTEDPDTHKPRPNFTAAASEVEGQTPRSFRAYLSPFLFPDVADVLEYHILGSDKNGNARWLGTGTLIVRENPANGSPVPPEIIPADTYIRNPVTGLYHKLIAVVDEDGNLTINLADEGVNR